MTIVPEKFYRTPTIVSYTSLLAERRIMKSRN